ncbi:MAG: hypothetical protein HWN81_06085 [Candidatus Lokiarchaeota archaeon]|nr:hypothetical protein [Candidatus Lokiarchaeota archaeon]
MKEYVKNVTEFYYGSYVFYYILINPEEKIRKTGMTLTFDVGFVAQILKTQELILRGATTSKSNTHGVNKTIRLKDIKNSIKEIIEF